MKEERALVLTMIGVLAAMLLGFAVSVSEAHSAPAECLYLGKQQGQDMIVNRCGACRVAKIEYRQKGQLTLYRNLYVPEGSKVPMPYLGTARSKIVTESDCANPVKSPLQQADKQMREPQCVHLKQTRSGAIALVNVCATCRVAVVEQQSGAGERRQLITAGARAAVPVSLTGNTARVIGERKC